MIVVIALVALALLVLLFAVRQAGVIVARLPAVVEEELQARLHRQVSIGNLRVTSLTTAEVTDLRIANGKSFTEGLLFTAPRITLSFDAWGLFRQKRPFPRIVKRIGIYSPRLRLVRDSQGIWNIQDLLIQPPAPPDERYRGQVEVHSGVIEVVDYSASLPRPPESNSLESIRASLNFAPRHSFLVDISATGAHRRVGLVMATGRWGIDRPVTNLRLTAKDASPHYWLDYFSNIQAWDVTGGYMEGVALLTQPRGRAIVARGSASVSDAILRSPHLNTPIHRFSARATFVGTDINLVGRGFLDQSPITVEGDVSGFSRVNLRVRSRRMQMDRLYAAVKVLPDAAYLRWPVRGTLEGRVTGLARNPTVTAEVRVSRLWVGQALATNVVASGSYARGTISVARATAHLAGGMISLLGNIHIASRRVSIAGIASRIEIRALPISAGLYMSGRADARFTVEHQRGLLRAHIMADVMQGRTQALEFQRGSIDAVVSGPRQAEMVLRISNGRVSELGFHNASADLSLRDETIVVRRSTIRALQGVIRLSGRINLSGGGLDLRIRATDAGLQALLSPLGYSDVTGAADFSGSLTGSFKDPRLVGRIAARNGRLRQIDYDLFVAILDATRERLLVKNALIRRQRGELVAVGTVGITKGAAPRFQVSVAARGISVEELTAILNIPIGAQGTTGANLYIVGTYPDLRLSGDVFVDQATIAGITLDSLALRLRSADSRTEITELSAFRDGMRIKGTGFIEPGGRLTIDVAGENLELSLLNNVLYPYLTLSGPMSVRARITGTISRPMAQGKIASPAPTINGEGFDTLSVSLAWDGERLTLENAVLADGSTAHLLHRLTYRPADSYFELNMALRSASARRAVAMANRSPLTALPQGERLRAILAAIPTPVAGEFDALLQLSGTADDPSGGISVTAADLLLPERPALDLVLNAEVSDGSVFLNQALLTLPDGASASMTGSISLKQSRLSLVGQATNMPVTLIVPSSSGETGGVLNAVFNVSGSLDNPVATLSVSSTNFRIAGFRADLINAPRIVAANNQLRFEELTIEAGVNRIAVTGYLPWVWGAPFVPADQPLSIQASLVEGNLSVLTSLSTIVQHADGTLSADLSIAGTPQSPTLSGRLSVVNGVLDLAAFDNDFTNVNLEARFTGSSLLIERLTGSSSLGGSFSVQGSLTFANAISDQLSLIIYPDALRVDVAKGYFSPEAHIVLSTTGQLVVSQTFQSPLIQGDILISDARIELPADEIATGFSAPPLPIQPQLDIALNLARDVVIRRGGLSLEVVGPVTLTGSGDGPVLTGTVQVVDGQIRYPGRTLDIVPGGNLSFLLAPPRPAIVVVDIQATARLLAPSPITGRITRYNVLLNIAGPIGGLELDVSVSPPGLSDLEVYAFLFGGAALEALLRGLPPEQVFQEQIGQLILGFAIPGIFQPIEIGGLALALEPGLGAPVVLTVAASLNDRVFLTYTQSVISGEPFGTLSLGYTLSPQLDFGVQWEGRRGVAEDTTYLIRYYRRF